MGQLRIDRRLAAATLLIAMELALLSGCTTNLKQSLTQTVTAFYAQVTSKDDPYGSFNVTPLWPKLPVDGPQVVKAEVGNIPDQAVDGNWPVLAHMEVRTEQGKVNLSEKTSWARKENRWVLNGVEFIEAELAGWSDAKDIGAGLLAFEHEGQTWLLDTTTGELTLVANPEASGSDGDHPLHVAEWAPDGSGLLLYTDIAAYWHRPATGRTAKLVDIGNYGGVTWSRDGKYGLLDWGTDVIRTVEIIDVTQSEVIGRLAAYAAIWSPDGEIFIAKPEPVTPVWPAGDGSSLSVARVEIDSNASAGSAVLTVNVVTGTSTAMFIPRGFGRDGALYYTQTELQGGKEAVSWWRWDGEAKRGVRQWSEPALEPPEAAPTLQLPAQLGGPRLVRVEVSRDGRWGFFAAAEDELGSGIYLIDLTAPGQWERIVTGGSPRWATGTQSED